MSSEARGRSRRGLSYDVLVDLCDDRIGCGRRASHGRTVRYRCPLHDDIVPSLVISCGHDGRALVFCHGCVDGRVYGRLLRWLCGSNAGPAVGKAKGSRSGGPGGAFVSTGHLVMRYPYRDAAGRLIAEHHRYSDKAFPWYRNLSPDGQTPAMLLGLGGVQLPCLYRLNEIGERARVVGYALLVEGEKDVDNLWALGYPATCTPRGSDWPVPGVVDLFVTLGLPVHVIRDKDPEDNPRGQTWAEGVRRDLTTAGLEVHVYETPVDLKGADASDHLAAGLDLTSLLVVEEASR